MIHAGAKNLSVAAVSYDASNTPTLALNTTTLPATGNAPWQMVVVRQPGY
jgi:hypothetical protein